MDTSKILPLLVYLFIVVTVVERVTDVVKEVFPRRTWASQRVWVLTLRLIGFVCGYAVAYALPHKDLIYIDSLSPMTVNIIIGIVCSSSSGFMHDLILLIKK